MKLLTHNMLSSKCLKGVNVGFPLAIKAKDVKINEVEYNEVFLQRIVPKLEWDAFYAAAESLGKAGDLPKAPMDGYESNTDFLKKLHHVLLEVEVVDGELICPETGRKFPISSGIPNMLLNEDEI